jgi:hypothetical protein
VSAALDDLRVARYARQLLVPGFDPKNPPTLLPPDLRAKLKNL